jgi:hypothetical protein
MEGTGPDAVACWLNAHAVCTGWTPWSEWISVPAVGLRNWIAIPRALVTSAAVGVVSIDQSTTLCGSPFPPGRRQLWMAKFMRSVAGSLRPATSGAGAGVRTQNLVFDGTGPDHVFSTSRITLMAEEYGEAKLRSK